jgi:7-cyano-7-deazaguanine synthase
MSRGGEAAVTRAVVLLSGGLDSATVLALARERGLDCHALSIAYGQRHEVELEAAAKVARALGAREHRIMQVDLAGIGGSALTDHSIPVPTSPGVGGIPVTYVPARNTIMLSLALAWAEVLDAQQIHVGVNAIDYSGYPDCRPEFIAEFERLAKLATRAGVQGATLSIRAPLIHMSKAQIVREGTRLGVDYALTVSCYQADAKGRACGLCDSCRLRREGFVSAGIPDPTRYRPSGGQAGKQIV